MCSRKPDFKAAGLAAIVTVTSVIPFGGASAIDLFDNTNTLAVTNCLSGPPPSNPCVPQFTLSVPALINQVVDYHWNPDAQGNGRGATPGTISIAKDTGQIIGTFNAYGTAGTNGVPNVNWVADVVALTLPAGTYKVIDSDPATWSQNAGKGFAIVRGTSPPPIPPPPVTLTGVNPAHYHCYQVTGAPNPKRVLLRDQFQTTQVFSTKPVMLCAPVQKNDEEVKDTKTHLLCYQIEGAKPPNKTARVSNQFGTEFLRIFNSQLLCVPSLKTLSGSSLTLRPQRPCFVAPPSPPGVRYGTRDLALGADLSPGVRQDVLLLVNTRGTAAPQFQFGVGGPTSDTFEICVSRPGTSIAPFGGASVTWTVEDPVDPSKMTTWATVLNIFVSPLQIQQLSLVQGHGVLKVDVTAAMIANAIRALVPPGYHSGRVLVVIQVAGATFQLAIDVGQQ